MAFAPFSLSLSRSLLDFSSAFILGFKCNNIKLLLYSHSLHSVCRFLRALVEYRTKDNNIHHVKVSLPTKGAEEWNRNQSQLYMPESRTCLAVLSESKTLRYNVNESECTLWNGKVKRRPYATSKQMREKNTHK